MLKRADNPHVDYKALVRKGYDRCAEAYNAARQGEAEQLHLLTERLLPGARVLDIGCGGGRPICSTLAERCSVTGVDISPVQIEAAMREVPAGHFLCADIMSLDFPADHFDAVTSFYAIFHLPKDEHPERLARIRRWLRPKGYLMCTVANHDQEPYTEDGFFGVTMYWSNHSREQYVEMLNRLGFRILIDTTLSSGFENQPPESHPLILAQKLAV